MNVSCGSLELVSNYVWPVLAHFCHLLSLPLLLNAHLKAVVCSFIIAGVIVTVQSDSALLFVQRTLSVCSLYKKTNVFREADNKDYFLLAQWFKIFGSFRSVVLCVRKRFTYCTECFRTLCQQINLSTVPRPILYRMLCRCWTLLAVMWKIGFLKSLPEQEIEISGVSRSIVVAIDRVCLVLTSLYPLSRRRHRHHRTCIIAKGSEAAWSGVDLIRAGVIVTLLTWVSDTCVCAVLLLLRQTDLNEVMVM